LHEPSHGIELLETRLQLAARPAIGAMIAAVERAPRREHAGEKPIREDRTREHAGFAVREIRGQIVEIARKEEVIGKLDHFRALAERGPRDGRVARADAPGGDGAARLQLFERGRRIAAGNRGEAGVVQKNDVDLVLAQSLLGTRHGFAQVVALETFVRLLVRRRHRRRLGALRPDFGDDADRLAGEPLAEAPFDRSATVDVGGFEGGDAELERAIDHAIAFGRVDGTIGLAR